MKAGSRRAPTERISLLTSGWTRHRPLPAVPRTRSPALSPRLFLICASQGNPPTSSRPQDVRRWNPPVLGALSPRPQLPFQRNAAPPGPCALPARSATPPLRRALPPPRRLSAAHLPPAARAPSPVRPPYSVKRRPPTPPSTLCDMSPPTPRSPCPQSPAAFRREASPGVPRSARLPSPALQTPGLRGPPAPSASPQPK